MLGSRSHSRLDRSTDRAAAPRPLIVTSDEGLLDELLRLAAAAGAEVEVVPDPAAARSRWPSVPMVVVGDDQAAGLAALAPTRRRQVYVVGADASDPALWRHGLGLGAEQIVFLPDDETWLAERFADAVEGEAGDGVVVGVVGGRGGAGASVFATALAVGAARRDLSVMLIDLDPLGGGLDLVLGAEETSGLRWPDLADSRGRLSARALQTELPGRHGLTVLSWDRGDVRGVPAEVVTAVLAAARRACDVVVLDLPRRLDGAAEDALAMAATVLLLVPTEVRAVAAAARVAGGLTTIAADVRIVTRGPSSAGLDGPEVAAVLGLPLAADMEPEPRLAERLDRGDPPGTDSKGPLHAASARVLDDLYAGHGVRVA